MRHTLLAAVGAAALAFFATPEDASAHERHHARDRSVVVAGVFPYGHLAYANTYGHHCQRHPYGRAYGYWRNNDRHDGGRHGRHGQRDHHRHDRHDRRN